MANETIDGKVEGTDAKQQTPDAWDSNASYKKNPLYKTNVPNETIDNKLTSKDADTCFTLQLYEKVKNLEGECPGMGGCKVQEVQDILRACKTNSSKVWNLYNEAKNVLKTQEPKTHALEKTVEMLQSMDTNCGNQGKCGDYKRCYERLTDFLEKKVRGNGK